MAPELILRFSVGRDGLHIEGASSTPDESLTAPLTRQQARQLVMATLRALMAAKLEYEGQLHPVAKIQTDSSTRVRLIDNRPYRTWEVCKIYGGKRRLSRGTVARWVKRGLLRSARQGVRGLTSVFNRSDLVDFEAKCPEYCGRLAAYEAEKKGDPPHD